MSNWSPITIAGVKSQRITAFLTTAQSVAAAKGEADPVPNILQGVVDRLRNAVATGNTPDADPTKLPNSLHELAERMIARRMKTYCDKPLTNSEEAEALEDASYLNRIIDQRLRFEPADNPADAATVQPQPSPATSRPHHHFSRRQQDGI